MQKLKFTKTNIEAIPFAEQGQVFYGDSLLTGFGLRVGTNQKSYYVDGRVNGTKRRITVGRADYIPVDIARGKALALLAEMADGVDPVEEAKAVPAAR